MEQRAESTELTLLGNTLHSLRYEKNEKLKTVAKAVGINKGTMSKIEHGKYTAISFLHIKKFASYYGKTTIELMKMALSS